MTEQEALKLLCDLGYCCLTAEETEKVRATLAPSQLCSETCACSYCVGRREALALLGAGKETR